MRIITFALLVWGAMDARGQAVPCGAVDRGDLVVNEILFDSPGGLEFVEVYNRASCSIGLSRITLSDSRGTNEAVATTGTVDPGSMAVFVSNGDVFADAFPDARYMLLVRWPALNNGGDAVVVAVDGATVDSVYYASTWGVPGRSIERRHPDRPSIPATSWGPSSDPSGATPGQPNSLFAIDGDPPHVVYAEEEPGNVVYVRLSEPALPSSVTPERFRVAARHPASVNDGPSATEYRLLFDERPLAPDLWSGGLIDLSGNVSEDERVPLAALATPGSLRLNEIMYEPGAGSRVEYLELFNPTDQSVSLRGLRLGDGADTSGLRAWVLLTDERISIAAGGFVVAYQGGGPIPVGPALPVELQTFDVDPAENVAWIPLTSVTPRGLANNGQEIAVISVEGKVIELVNYNPDWHSLTLRELGRTEGTSLERVSTAGNGTSAMWTSSVAPNGGTPGAPNSHPPLEAETRDRPGIEVAPSPFSPDDDGIDDFASIRYRLKSEVAAVKVRVFDLQGREVGTIDEGHLSGAEGTLGWNGHDVLGRPLPTGVYVVVLEGISAETARAERHRALVTVANRR